MRFNNFNRLILGLCIILSSLSGFSQNGFRSADGWGIGWGTTDYWAPTGFGSTFGKMYTNSVGAGNRYFRLYTEWSGNTREHGPDGANDILLPLGVPYNLTTWGGSKAYYVSVNGLPHQRHYIFRTKYGDGIGNTPQLIIFEVQGEVRTVSLVTQVPANASVSSQTDVTVQAVLSGTLHTGQGVYLRYSTDDFVTSTIVEMSGLGTNYDAIIPAQSSGTTVKYYVFTSGQGQTIVHQDADWYTINGLTNNGQNFSYVVQSNPSVVVSPALPNDTEPVTIAFNAQGTSLEGATEVYLHAGVSTDFDNPTSFMYVVGNWGNNDGIGEMTSSGTNQWTITLTNGLRDYFGVPNTEDIFGLNFLFRNGDGSQIVNNFGSNYHYPITPNRYFLLNSPPFSPYLVPVNNTFILSAQANVEAAVWRLYSTDQNGNILQLINQENNQITYNYTVSVQSATSMYYRIEADFNGLLKYKTFELVGFNPVGELPRPSWVKKGINYHSDDPTKATLVLHAPTYTRFKNGQGGITGTNNTAPKEVVYVIGDFNNWTVSETYKMNRDRDGWDGTIDADNDGDRGDYWWITIDGLIPGQEYVFQYLIDGNLQVADPYTYKVSDFDDVYISPSVYANLIPYPNQAVDRASVIQTAREEFVWTAPSFIKPSTDKLNIYELHFRDFTQEGTFKAAMEKLDYIKGLGINAIHVMPVSEFEGNSSWGYNPNFYFAPDKAYGTDVDLKKFIDACHHREIQVFNDIVLNHAFYSNVMARMYWNNNQNKPANDNPWFNPDHKMVADPAGWWGADWNHESEHTQAMVDSILHFWLEEFNFDGFRFDFTKGFGQTAPDPSDPWASTPDPARVSLLMRMVNTMWQNKPGSVVIFEHLAWAVEDKELADNGILMWSGVGHHNDVKRFVLGYNQDNPDIYTSGIYNAPGRNFNFANWMSYAESHDEERLAYELNNYFNGTKNIDNTVNRMKLGMAFNLLMPGTRMIWQFQELAYDYSINYCGNGTVNSSCRTDPKPVRWDYYDDPKRKEMYRLFSYCFKLRQRYDLYGTAPDYGNIGLGAGNIQQPRVMRLSTPSGQHVIIVANIDPNAGHDVLPLYDVPGTWYRYNGQSAIDGTTFSVSNINAPYFLQPSELLIFTNFRLDECTDVRNNNDSGFGSLREAIICAPDGGTVTIEYPVFGQTIQLQSPLVIDKNITIKGFSSPNLFIDGSNLSTPVLDIAVGKSVNIEGISVTCAEGNINGRCVISRGHLSLGFTEFNDNVAQSSGSSIYIPSGGMMTLKYSNQISN